MSRTLFLIVGESGSGKDTVVDIVCQQHRRVKIRSYTTRPSRGYFDNTHIFVSKEDFPKPKYRAGYTKYNGFEYCATVHQIETCDFYIIDPAGIAYFKEHYKGKRPYKVVYIKTDKQVRFRRLILRGRKSGGSGKEVAEKAAERFVGDLQVFKGIEHECDCIIENNGTPEECAEKLWNYMCECQGNSNPN